MGRSHSRAVGANRGAVVGAVVSIKKTKRKIIYICDFCQGTDKDRVLLVKAGVNTPGKDIAICDECIVSCVNVLADCAGKFFKKSKVKP